MYRFAVLIISFLFLFLSNSYAENQDGPQCVKTWRSHAFDEIKVSRVLDTGEDSPGEIDLFEDNELAGGLTLVGVDYVPKFFNWAFSPEEVENKKWWVPRAVGLNVSLGVGTTVAGTDNEVVVGLGSIGIFVELFDFVGIEYGVMYAISPNKELDSTQRDDTAFYYGLRFNLKLLKKSFSRLVDSWNN